MKQTFGFGVFLSFLSLPVMALAFAVNQNDGWWVFGSGVLVGGFGVFLCAVAVILKCASLLFRK